jgi:hypothetical protein
MGGSCLRVRSGSWMGDDLTNLIVNMILRWRLKVKELSIREKCRSGLASVKDIVRLRVFTKL